MTEPYVSPHRPIARWVARVTDPPDGADVSGGQVVTGLVNDGAERSDARALRVFTEGGWLRLSVPAARPGARATPVLALHHPTRDRTYVELDDYGNPIAADQRGAALVSMFEEQWHTPPGRDDVMTALGAQSLELRHFLLHRLNAETDPPPALFHVLPWHDYDAVVHALLTGLDGTGGTPSPPELRHWFTPAGIGLAGPLCVLESGLRHGRDPSVLAGEARSLLTALLTADHRRIPSATAGLLADLVERLALRNRLLLHSARVIAARFRSGVTATRQVSFSVRLHSRLPMLGSEAGRTRTHKETYEDDRFSTRIWMSAAGQLRVTVRVPDLPAAEAGAWADPDGPLAMPVLLQPERRTGRRYWVPLKARGGALEGVLDVRFPQGRFRVDADGPPLPVTALDSVPPRQLLTSLRACTLPALLLWREGAAALPAAHAVRVALELLEQERSPATRDDG
ncbi:hypothetical protein ACWCP6_24505 [Streptomyces sp. NPDC002004]